MDRAEGVSGPSGPWGAGVRSQTGPCPRLGFRPCPCPLLPAKELSAQPLPTAVPREAPGLEETKAAGTYLGCKEGVGRGRGSPLTPGAEPAGLPPRAALLRSAPSAPALAAVLVQRRARARVCACACVRACVPPVHCSISAPRCAPPFAGAAHWLAGSQPGDAPRPLPSPAALLHLICFPCLRAGPRLP